MLESHWLDHVAPLKAVLDKAGLKADAREIVFFGADRRGDRNEEDVARRQLAASREVMIG